MVNSLDSIFSFWHHMSPRRQEGHDGFFLQHYSGELVSHEEIGFIIDSLLSFYGNITPGDLSVLGEKISKQDEEYTSAERADATKRKGLERRSSTGYLYLLSSGMGQYKIGKATCLDKRVKTLGIQIPFNLELVHSIPVTHMDRAETYLHDKFAHRRIKGEWFALDTEDVEWIKAITNLDDLAKETA